MTKAELVTGVRIFTLDEELSLRERLTALAYLETVIEESKEELEAQLED